MRNAMGRMAKWATALGAAAALLLGGCEGSATQTTNGGLQPGEVQGMLVDASGKAVSGAAVEAWVSGQEPGKGGGAKAVTDEKGVYLLKSLPQGTYNVLAAKDADAALIPSVEVHEIGVAVGTTTLKPAGSITGGVANEVGPLEQAFCYIPGSSFLSITGPDGSCSLDRVPEGTYTVKYTATGYVAETDSGVKVQSGKATPLNPKTLELDVSSPLPAPKGLTAKVDPASGKITLSWSKVLLDNIAYEARLSYGNGPDSMIELGGGEDTLLLDDFTRQLFNPSGRWEGKAKGTVSYQVRTVDPDGQGRYSAPFKVEIAKPTAYSNDVSFGSLASDTASCLTAFRYAFAFAAADTESVIRYYGVQSKDTEGKYSGGTFLYGGSGLDGTTFDLPPFDWYPGIGGGTTRKGDSDFRLVVQARFRSGWKKDFIVELKNDGNGCFQASLPRPPAPADSFPTYEF